MGDGDFLEKRMDIILAVIDRTGDRPGFEQIIVHGHCQQEHAIDEASAQGLVVMGISQGQHGLAEGRGDQAIGLVGIAGKNRETRLERRVLELDPLLLAELVLEEPLERVADCATVQANEGAAIEYRGARVLTALCDLGVDHLETGIAIAVDEQILTRPNEPDAATPKRVNRSWSNWSPGSRLYLRPPRNLHIDPISMSRNASWWPC